MRLTFSRQQTSLPTRTISKLFVLLAQTQSNASVKGSGDDRLIKTVSDYDAKFGASGVSSGGSFGTYAARDPGGEIQQGGNALQVSTCDRTTLNITLLGGTGGGAGSGATTSAVVDVLGVTRMLLYPRPLILSSLLY